MAGSKSLLILAIDWHKRSMLMVKCYSATCSGPHSLIPFPIFLVHPFYITGSRNRFYSKHETKLYICRWVYWLCDIWTGLYINVPIISKNKKKDVLCRLQFWDKAYVMFAPLFQFLAHILNPITNYWAVSFVQSVLLISNTCLKQPLNNRQNEGLEHSWYFNAGRK